MLEISRLPDKTAVIEAARQDLVAYLARCHEAGKDVLLCLSGGSALDLVAQGFPDSILGPWVTITVLDERYTHDPAVSNFAQLERIGFVETARQAGCQIIDTRVTGPEESREQLARRYEAGLRDWVQAHPEGEIVATIGMGPDGHTAGLIPSAENFATTFADTAAWVVGYRVATQPEPQRERVTTTFAFLGLVTYGVLVMMGEEKRAALSALTAEVGDKFVTPARIWRTSPGQIHGYTDIAV